MNFLFHGSEVEIDKRILEEIKDPLLHILRNCIAHGIEKPEERLNKGKSSTGKITYKIDQNSNLVEIVIKDDGAGINQQKVIASAIKRGVITQEEGQNLSTDQVMDFIFQSEFSTSPIITDISGRGLGLAIVKEKIAKLGGSITVESIPSQGTTFVLSLPINLSTFRGVIVKAGNNSLFYPPPACNRL